MVPEVLEYIEEYMSKGLEYAKTIDKECESKINFYFYHSDNYEDYCEKTVDYRNKSCAADTVITMLTPFDEIEYWEFDDLDKECLMTLDEFKIQCSKEYFCITDYDGHGYYAKDDKVYKLYASPRMIRNGFVRNEFTHVCWYNK